MPDTIPHTGPYDNDFDDPLFDVDLDGYEPDSEERTTALIAHLSGFAGFVFPFGNIIGPAVVYYTKREDSAFIEHQSREALNFQISITIAMIVAGILSVVLIGIPILIALGIAWVAFPIIAAVRTNEGTRYRYPYSWRLVS
ncbi:MAG: DUF4870 domain-containing protein [Bacteroidota bacterium]